MVKLSESQAKEMDVILPKIIRSLVKEKLLENGILLREEEKLELLTRGKTAKLLSVSLPTLHQWTLNGTIKAHRIGTRVLYKMEDIKDALKQIDSKTKKGGQSC